MNNKKSIDNLEERIREEVQAELDEIDEKVAEHKRLHPMEYPADLDFKVMERIRKAEEEKKAYERLSEEDKEALRIGREMLLRKELEMEEGEETVEKVVYFRSKKKPWKMYVLVAVVAIMVLAMGTTCLGGKPFILEMANHLVGEKEMTKVDSNSEDDMEIVEALTEEEQFEQEVEEAFSTNYVRLGYLPKGAEFYRGDIDKTNKWVCFLYEYEDQIIQYQVLFNYRGGSHSYDVEDNIIKESVEKIGDVEIELYECELPEGEKEFVAVFEYEKIFYVLNAPVSEQEMQKILKNLIFF